MSRTVSRALDLLQAVVAAQRPLALMEIVELTDIDKSTAQRLLLFLVDRGMLARDDVTKRFELGPETFVLSASVGARSNVRVISGPHLLVLRDLSKESISLHLRVGSRRVCVDGQDSLQPVRRVVPIGESLPLHLGPSGKVILAQLPEDELTSVLADADLSKAARTQMNDDLAFVRAKGYLHTVGDRTEGVRAISAPIFDFRGVTASVTIAGPSERWTESAAARCVLALIDSAAAISTSLGARQ